MRRRRQRELMNSPAELNITAFMNLMVILVPFLLITAVFSRMSILGLDIPPPGAAGHADKDRLQLEITLRHDGLDVGDRRGGLIRHLAMTGGHYDYTGLSSLLQEIKRRYPQEHSVVLLLEPDIAYDALVQVMDATRVADIKQPGGSARAALFPDIALGDAPPSHTGG